MKFFIQGKIKCNKMMNQLIDLNLFLPKFYPKSQQIELKLNPILSNLRQSNIVSYHQLQNKSLFSKQLQTIPHSHQITQKPYIQDLSLLEHNQSIFDNSKTQLIFAKTAYASKFTSSKNRNTFYSTLQTPDHLHTRTPHRPRNDSFQLRSKTSDKTKAKKPQILVPGTADFAKNVQQLDLQKLNFFIKNPQSQLDFDDDLCNYIRLKMLTKNPYFSGGKFSKIKKHLVEQINLEQIEKKFFKSTSSHTKYKDFFERMILRKRQNSQQIEKFNKSFYNTLPSKKNQNTTIPQKEQKLDEKTLTKFNISKHTHNHNIDRQDSPLLKKGFSPQRNKMSLKAKFLFRKSPIETDYSPLDSKQDSEYLNNQQLQMQFHGKAPSPSLQKYLQARNKKFNMQKDIMKRAYRVEYA